MPRGVTGKKRAPPGSDESESFSDSASDASGNGSDPEADYGKRGGKVAPIAKRASSRPVRQASLNARSVAAKLAKAEEKSDGDEDEEDEEEEAPAAAPTKAASTPHLNDDDVAKNVGMNSFLRGQEYLNGRLKDFQEDKPSQTISAKCKGSAADDYSIKVTFLAGSNIKAQCTCPVGAEGKCKHVACLLLHWQEVATGVKKDRNRRAPAEAAKVEQKMNEISSLAVPRLKELLKLNDQPVSGSKQDLLERCADGMAFGALPRCGKCGGGRLRYKQGCYFCPGFMEDDTFIECDFFAENVARAPWKTTA